jgi:hypothetical protein
VNVGNLTIWRLCVSPVSMSPQWPGNIPRVSIGYRNEVGVAWLGDKDIGI